MRRAAVILCLTSACSFPFDDESTVEDLRVLAVQAEPAEVLIDIPQALKDRLFSEDPGVRAAAVPDLFPLYVDQIASHPVTMRPLVVDPAGAGRALHVEMTACPNRPEAAGGEGGPGGANDTVGSTVCPRDPAVSQILPTREAPPGEIVLHYVPTFEFLTRVFYADPTGVLFGWPVNIQFAIRSETEEVVAVKRALYTLRIPDDPSHWPHQPNQNPLIPSVVAYAARGDGKEPLEAGAPRAVPLGGTVLIEPGLAEREEYVTSVLDARTRTTRVKVIPQETVRYSFYATAGTFGPMNTSSEPSPLFKRSDVLHLESTYTAPRIMPADPLVTVWIVVRDERGGSSHVVRQVRLE